MEEQKHGQRDEENYKSSTEGDRNCIMVQKAGAVQHIFHTWKVLFGMEGTTTEYISGRYLNSMGKGDLSVALGTCNWGEKSNFYRKLLLSRVWRNVELAISGASIIFISTIHSYLSRQQVCWLRPELPSSHLAPVVQKQVMRHWCIAQVGSILNLSRKDCCSLSAVRLARVSYAGRRVLTYLRRDCCWPLFGPRARSTILPLVRSDCLSQKGCSDYPMCLSRPCSDSVRVDLYESSSWTTLNFVMSCWLIQDCYDCDSHSQGGADLCSVPARLILKTMVDRQSCAAAPPVPVVVHRPSLLHQWALAA